MKSLSIVVPLYCEQESVSHLVKRIHEALQGQGFKWELICVDDGSIDNTAVELRKAQQHYGAYVRIIEFQRNFGQTAAMQAGIDAARGELIVTMDGDLQNDPSDIPRLVAELEARDLDMLQGYREDRQDAYLMRKLPSKIANRLIARVTGVKLQDYGCSLKVYRAEIIKQVRLFGEMHRFIPVWVASVTKPSRIGESRVDHHARQFGQSKYGISRTFRVILDLLSVFFFLKFRARPGHFFGYAGLVLGSLGSLVMLYLGFIKFVLGDDIGGRPLFLVGILLLLAALQFITTGVLAEMMSRIFFQTSDVVGYPVQVKGIEDKISDSDWRADHAPSYKEPSSQEPSNQS